MAKQDVQNSVGATNYVLFIFGVSLLAVLNSLVFFVTFLFERSDVVANGLTVLWAMDLVLSAILFLDFGLRLYIAPRRAEYFFRRRGWLDFIGSFPALAVFRLVRMWRTLRDLGNKGEHVVLNEVKRARANGALLLIVWLVLVVLELSSVSVLFFEHNVAGAKILTASDALWWSFQTITTVGYGDVYPITNAGREVGVLLMIVGVGLFGTFTAWLANWFFGPSRQTAAERETIGADVTKIAEMDEQLGRSKK